MRYVLALCLALAGLAHLCAAPPTITAPATAAYGRSAVLSVTATDDGGDDGLTYTWSVPSKPDGAPDPTFGMNANNAARVVVTTFAASGAYTFRVTVADAGGAMVTSSVGVTVPQFASSLAVAPATATLTTGDTQQFAALVLDQFGAPLSQQPTLAWAANAGTITAEGLFTAAPAAGTATIRAIAGSLTDTATVTVQAVTPPGPPAPGLYYDAAAKVLTIHGSPGADSVTIQPYLQNNLPRLHITLMWRSPTTGALVGSQVQTYALPDVTQIVAHLYAGNDKFYCYASPPCEVWGGDGADVIYGGSGADKLHGGAGIDLIRGFAGDDFIDGGAGADTIYGGPGNDTIVADPADNAFPD